MKTRSTIVTLSLIALALSGCSTSEPAAAQASEPAAAIPVRLAPIDRTPAREPLELPGLVMPRDTFDLGFPGGGVILDVLVDAGDEVQRGQVLARLDATAARATVMQARESLARAERDLGRARTLSESGSLPSATFEDAQTGAEVARANVAAAGFALRYSTLRAPDDGWVDARLADAREVIGPGQPVLRIASRARGWVLRVAVPDRSVARLHEGDAATITLDAMPERTLDARIVEIARLPSIGSGTYDVEIAFDAPAELTMRTGLVGRVSIPIGETFGASVPVSALVDGRDHDAAVLVVDGGRARRVPVRVAFLRGDHAVLASALDDVDAVIGVGADRLDPGAHVEPITEE
ncbi:efflux RND transporter periplasmic adaptor subunit [Sandaracinus amylolyticus]|uniref:Membrane-fusion protein n=1 Tax=Sandaracinus amylolyticus TaxID=927083 RepID=A0A0F6W7E0_9BACT|nr:efflux RND transporter periplasmic adaptor subunit [Sandaracinus amylolyticus]AKF09317.1 Membrane-fusion protein [Sandaracinus amylolyticus]